MKNPPGRRVIIADFVAGLRRDGIVAPFVIDGPINRHSFETYVACVIVPDLRRATS